MSSGVVAYFFDGVTGWFEEDDVDFVEEDVG